MTISLARVRRHLHWWSATLVLTGFAVAWLMTALPARELLVKFLLYQVHKSIGLIVLVLTVARLGLTWRARAWPRGKRAALLALLLVVPVFGYLAAASSPTDVPTLFFLLVRVPHLIGPDAAVYGAIRPVHLWLAVALVGLAVWHGMEMRARYRRRRPA